MAHKKGQGSVRNGRDSNSKRRGIKKYDGETVTIGSIIVLQCGTRWHPGANVKRAKNDSLFAMADGKVKFTNDGRRVNVEPCAV
jgi:large subunit ribosomal protein L27